MQQGTLSGCRARVSTGSFARTRTVKAHATLLSRPPSSNKQQPSSSQQTSQQPQQQLKPYARPPVKSSEEIVAMILGGGSGTDLWPLTNSRAEPAVPFAGLFRLIDVPLSNCIHSGISNIYVLTQYNATSLNRHLSRAYQFLNNVTFVGHGSGFVETLAASQRPGLESKEAWYQGTADAVRRYLYLFDEAKHEACEDVLIMAADQLYRMDYTQLLNYHRAKGADVTIATTPADEERATHLGVLTVDRGLNVLEFHEKPPRTQLATMSIDTLDYGFADTEEEAVSKPFVASMGMYVIKRKVLQDLLSTRFPRAVDFSRDILSLMHGELKICAYPHHGYWEDVGSLKDYYAANMAMAADTSRLHLFDRDAPLYSEARVLPPSKVFGASVADSLVGDACRIEQGSSVKNSVIGSCAFIGRDCYVKDSIIFGADTIDTAEARAAEAASGATPLGIGDNTQLERAIVDSNARIGPNCVLKNQEGVVDGSNSSLPKGIVIKDGILVVMRGAVIPAGTKV
ncbi:nucleotide-diphospho-sugar transferase [Scenedesmus sp. NREL 46B-D3]|nr:nucleotide-diphospho-sugar transferase [Scenedesmus sp. NREL 46B-D3]